MLARLARGERVAYVSDAGTPAVSDPGAALVAAVREAGYRVVPIPGASSALAALSAAGDAGTAASRSSAFSPARGNERARALARARAAAPTQVLFEAPHRIEALAAALAPACPERTADAVPRADQAVRDGRDDAGARPAGLAGGRRESARGEFVVVLHALAASTTRAGRDGATTRCSRPLLAALPLKQAVALAAEIGGAPRNLLYARALGSRTAARPKTSRVLAPRRWLRGFVATCASCFWAWMFALARFCMRSRWRRSLA